MPASQEEITAIDNFYSAYFCCRHNLRKVLAEDRYSRNKGANFSHNVSLRMDLRTRKLKNGKSKTYFRRVMSRSCENLILMTRKFCPNLRLVRHVKTVDSVYEYDSKRWTYAVNIIFDFECVYKELNK